MKRALRLAALLFFCALTFGLRSHNLREVFIDGKIYLADADCYSRMTRARMVAEHPGMIVRHHDFENFPQGVTPHTTAPLDYLIVAGKTALDAGFAVFDSDKTSVLHDQTLDLAGALISPLLAALGTVFLAVWAWTLRLRFWGMALLLYAVSPILVHGTQLGRPDHQALLILLLAVALGAEIALATTSASVGEADSFPYRRAAWGMVAGIGWALSLWVSLYEPLIMIGAVLALWLVFDRRALLAPERRAGWIAFVAILVVAFLLEGWRITTPDAAMRGYFGRWKATIGELAHLDLRSPVLFQWLGWTVLAAPVLLLLARKIERRALPVLALLLTTFALTIWQIRWGYFFAVVFILAVPLFMPALRRGWVAWAVFLIALWPVAQDWDARLFPDELAQRDVKVKRAEVVALRTIVAEKTNGGPFIAPWWLSPPIAYWTGQPGVAGSSHQSLPGTVDTASFFLSRTPQEAAAILRARKVRWFLNDEPSRTIATSATLLGIAAPKLPLAEAFQSHELPPKWLPVDDTPGWEAPIKNGFYTIWTVDEIPAAVAAPNER